MPGEYEVFVDDNYHYQDASARYRLGAFADCASAVAACQVLVDTWLRETHRPGITAAQLWEAYTHFGEDPFIRSADPTCRFSAWDYARARCEQIVKTG